jgi:hypothetical protein
MESIFIFQGFEFIAMACAMTGAYFMSMNPKKCPNHMVWAFVAFGTSNIFGLQYAMYYLMIPLIIQQALFFHSAVLGVNETVGRRWKGKTLKKVERTTLTLMILSFTAAFFVAYVFGEEANLKVTFLEVVAAVMAITGSYLMRKETYNALKIAFILYFVADVFYVYIAIERELWFFMIQSAFFIYTSWRGLMNLKERV